MKSRLLCHLFTSIILIKCMNAKDITTLSVVTLIEEADGDLIKAIDKALEGVKLSNGTNLKVIHHPILFIQGKEYPIYSQICDYLESGLSILVDMTWEGWIYAKKLAESTDLPYIHLDISNQQFVRASTDFLHYRNATDAALVFPSDDDLNQGVMYLVGNTVVRIIVLNGFKGNSTDSLRQMKPVPSHFVMYGSVENLRNLLEKANTSSLLNRDSIWTLVLMDFGNISLSGFPSLVSLIKLSPSACCILKKPIYKTISSGNGTSYNNCGCETKSVKEMLAENAFVVFGQIFANMYEDTGSFTLATANCSNSPNLSNNRTNRNKFIIYAEDIVNGLHHVKFNANSSRFTWNMEMDVYLHNSSGTHWIGKWNMEDEFQNIAGDEDELVKRFFRVGTIVEVPFVINKTDINGNPILDEYGEPVLDGFCIELLDKLSKEMRFNYKIRFPTTGGHGKKLKNGTWDGLIGDLVSGETDMIIASLTITSEREEVVDFVAPYFEQSGILIVMRKPIKSTSLFKFMSVLKEEVWWCILAALVVTALVLWVVDKYSPYSGRNKQLYPYKCREFTLSECFWFALTSMTPQGGGEPPKAVSGRILVAAYWIFVVLMLATFTANLAAFLTVERMQSPVNSLEELAKQSKINYTVVKDTSIHQYFINMASAEEELYRVWKDMTLNSSSDQAKFRVWDYPIKEQYTRILSVINGTGLLNTAEEGYDKINNDLEGKLAFIHDAATLRYQIYHNCNFTEVGEPFAEQPYAIAVQSGSHLQDEIGKHLLELQKDRYFETLSQKYWNSSLRKECPDSDDSEGITLASIGGVFIATLVGLVIGMLTLIGEIIFYRRQKKSKIVAIKVKPKKAMESK